MMSDPEKALLARVYRERDDMAKAYRTAAKVIDESLPGIAAHASEAVDKQRAAEARVEQLEANIQRWRLSLGGQHGLAWLATEMTSALHASPDTKEGTA